MDWKLICEVGFKILTAAVAGAAVFVGISKSLDGGNEKKKVQKTANSFEAQPFPGTEQQPPSQSCNQQQEPIEEPTVLKSMRATQDTCGKLFAFVQSLTMVTENLTRIFGGNVGGIPYGSQPYYSDPWSYRQPVNPGNGQTWTRISPFIIEAGPVNPSNKGYPYC